MSTSSRDRRPSEDLSCKVYIGGLGNGADSHEIEAAFGAFGRVQNVWVARNPPGFAFVAFEDPRDADDAVRCLDGTKLNGKRVRVEKSSGESRWEKWNISPPASADTQGVTLEYKDIKEAILQRKQLRLSRVVGRGRNAEHSDPESSSSLDSRSRHRRRRSSSGSNSDILSFSEQTRRREKFTHERRSLDCKRRRSPSKRTRRRTAKRERKRTRRQRYSRRSYDSSSSRSSSVRMRSSSERDRPRRRSKSRSKSRSRRKMQDDQVKDGPVAWNRNGEIGGHRNECPAGNEITVNTTSKPVCEAVNATKLQSETVNLKSTGSEIANVGKHGSRKWVAIGSKNKSSSELVAELCSVKTAQVIGSKNKSSSELVAEPCSVKTAQVPLMCSCMAAILKAVVVNAQTQTELIIQRTAGVQCQRILEPMRRLPTKRTTTTRDKISVAKPVVEQQEGKDGASKGGGQDGVVVT